MNFVPRICEGVYSVGARDWSRRLFDSLIPLPEGTSYNSFLVIGSEASALIDSVQKDFCGDWFEKISGKESVSEVSYLIMNHAEPDHAGSIPFFLKENKKAKLVLTEKGARMAEVFYGVPRERMKIVKEGEVISLGGKSIQFIEAPMLHWPETMFSFLKEDGILFSCDFFGAHLAKGVYAEEVPETLDYAQKYFGEIMMPFKNMGEKALEKIKPLDIKVIAPSHGPIYKNPKPILEKYFDWTSGRTRKKVLIAFASMWGSTEKLVNEATNVFLEQGIEVARHNLSSIDFGEFAADLVDSKAIVFGSPTVLGGMHPLALNAVYLTRVLKPPAKYFAFLSSFGWGGAAVRHAQEVLSGSGIDFIGAVEVNGVPNESDLEKARNLAKEISQKIN